MTGRAKAWRSEPWVWLLIALPLSAVIGGIVTIYLAVSSDDGLVVDDYYKKGMEINKTLERENLAFDLGIGASIRLAGNTGQLSVKLSGNDRFVYPDHLTLRFLHPTVAGQDFTVPLVHEGDGRYRGSVDLSRNLSGRRYLQLDTADWRLTGEAVFPQQPENNLEISLGD